MAGWNDWSGFSSSYRQEAVFSYGSSSRSGTIASTLSTAYASSGSRFSTFSMEALATHFDSLVIHEELNGNNDMDDTEEAEEEQAEEEEAEEEEAVAVQDQEVGDVNVKRWITALGVGWVLRHHLHYDGASAGEEELNRDSRSWIRALHQIADTFCLKRRLLPDVATRERPSIGQPGEHVSVPDRYHLALLIQETMLKMLVFVDAVVAWEPYTTEEYLSMDSVMQPSSYSKLSNQHSLHDALSEASNKILMMFDSRTSVEVKRVENEIATLLSAYKSKLGEATRSTVEKIFWMNMVIKDGHDSLRPQGSLDVHEVTRSMMRYIRFLCSNYSLVDTAICDNYVLSTEKEQPLDGMTVELVSCLQKKLASISDSFPDQALKFLFLLNNSYFIMDECSCCLQKPKLPDGFIIQTMDHMERYLQVSWAPLLSWLINSPYFCWGEYDSQLSKFESEFQKIYNTQKQWKVPDPRLRIRLRQVITNKIIPAYQEYIEDNKVTNPKISPLELDVMLQELFEG